MAKIKHLWKGYYNFNRELYIERCHAYTEKQAHFIFCRRLAGKEGVSLGMIMNKFNGRDNYKVEMEIEYEEE